MKLVKDTIITYVSNYLANLHEHDIPFEYYYLNRDHPECTIYNMSDYEIAYKYPFSGERLILDCWSLLKEYDMVTDTDWEEFIDTIHNLVIKAKQELSNNEKSRH